jgi:hypothetical protein
MFPWQILVIPLLLFAAWLLSNLFKAGDDSKDASSLNRGDFRKPPPRQVSSDLDRFLAQTRQRRDIKGQQRQAIPRSEGRPATQPGRHPQRLRDQSLAATTPAVRRSPSSPPPVTTGRPVLLELAPDQGVPQPVPLASHVEPRIAPPVEVVASTASILGSTPGLGTGKNPLSSSVLNQVIPLLRSPQSAAVGLVLREVLDRPRCHRPRVPPNG